MSPLVNHKSLTPVLALLLAAPFAASAYAAQSATTPAPAAHKPATAATTTKSTVTGTARRTGAAASSAVKLPPGVPPVHGLVHSAFTLRYQEISIGTGAVAEPNKYYKVAYTGWFAADGKKFDSSYDHPDKAPIQFPQGRGRVIPGWDQGFEGMKIGGKRRLFIPYQLAYGVAGRAPVIPAKADLIFDIELVGVSDTPPAGMMPPGHPQFSRPAGAPGAPGTPATPGTPTPATGPQTPPATPKPVDPTAPTVAPNSAKPSAPAAPATPPPAATPDKPANPAQPNQ